MAHDDSQERTEQATEKRLRDSREKGQVARSKELNTMLAMLTSILAFMLFGNQISTSMMKMFEYGLKVSHAEAFDDRFLLKKMFASLTQVEMIFLPLLLITVVIVLIAPVMMGGFVFSSDSIAPKLERMDPIKGLEKIISWKALMELIKALLKFLFVGGTFLIVCKVEIFDIFSLDDFDLNVGVAKSLQIILFSMLMMSLGLILIALMDVPFQIWDHNRQLKMTRQEVRDEQKDTDGRPEVKGKIRQTQRELARRRMMQDIPNADVIITNPTHYAVAIQYKQMVMSAPIVVAKGVDYVAELIRKVGNAHHIPFVEAPALARSLYYHVEIKEEIPTGLYVAVAQVLAHVYELNQYKTGKGKYPGKIRNLEIPQELRR